MAPRVVVCASPAGEFKAHWYRPADPRRCVRCGGNGAARRARRNAAQSAARRRKFLAVGLCGRCGAAPLACADLCADCNDQRIDRQTEARRAAVATGRCVDCRDPSPGGASRCAGCRSVRRQKRLATLARGLCGTCFARPRAPGAASCRACLRKDRDRTRRWYREGRHGAAAQPFKVARVAFTTPQRPARLVYLPPSGSIAIGLAWAERRRGGILLGHE